MIRIVIAEDQKMLLGALSSLLQLEDDLEVVAEAKDGQEALEAIEEHLPDLCILDIEIPFLTGLEVAANVRAAGWPCKIMIVTTFTKPGFIRRAMELQVDSYLLKDEPIDRLIAAIRRVMKGEKVISTDLMTTYFLAQDSPFTEREQIVLRLVRDGKTTEQIAKSLYLTPGTVRNYISSAIQKLEVESRHQALQIAEEKGWI